MPPCPNDSGSALGTAIDAQLHYTGSATVSWDVYAGEEFVEDAAFSPEDYDVKPLDFGEVAAFLAAGNIIGWAQGRWEMGPARSATGRSWQRRSPTRRPPGSTGSSSGRGSGRSLRSAWSPTPRTGSPVRSRTPHALLQPGELGFLKAVTHVDGTARAQTVTPEQNPAMARLLTAFRDITGFSVLCNTSLNYSGRGFINRTSDLVEYGEEHSLDGYVVGNTFAVRRSPRV